MIEDRNDSRIPGELSTASLVIAILESRRAYHRALSLAREMLLSGSPCAMTWGDEPADELSTCASETVAGAPVYRPRAMAIRALGYPTFRKAGRLARDRRGLRVIRTEDTV